MFTPKDQDLGLRCDAVAQGNPTTPLPVADSALSAPENLQTAPAFPTAAQDSSHSNSDPLQNAQNPLKNAPDPLQNAPTPLQTAQAPLHDAQYPLQDEDDLLQPDDVDPSQPEDGRRKAFLFYTNWYYDVQQNLREDELCSFVVCVVRYAAQGELPGEDVSPVVRTMFALIRNVIDADLEKYDRAVARNRAMTERRRELALLRNGEVTGQLPVDATGNQPVIMGTDNFQAIDTEQLQKNFPIHNTQDTILNTPNTINEEKKEEAEFVAPVFEEVREYWTERGFKSEVGEFFAYYDARNWRNRLGVHLRSWRRAASMWEDKFRRDVLPVRRREERVEREERRRAEDAERAEIRRREREAGMVDRERSARRAVSQEMGLYMYQRARLLTQGDEDRALELLKRAPDDAELFKRLTEGYRAA